MASTVGGSRSSAGVLTFRVEALESPKVNAGDQTNFVTPNGVWDVSTFRVNFLATITGTSNVCSLPRNMGSMIDKVVVYIDDVEVQNIANYGQLTRVMKDYAENNPSNDVLDNGAYLPSTISNAIFNVSNQPCCISDWYGLLGSSSIISGVLRIQVFWAPNAVLLRSVATSTYALSGLHAMIKRGDPDMITRTINFDDWTSATQANGSFAQQLHIGLQSECIDYVLATFLASDFDRAVSTSATAGTSRYFVHGTANPALDPSVMSIGFMLNGVPLNAGPINYAWASEHLQDVFGPGRSIQYPTTVCRDGTVVVRPLSEVLAYQWACAVPIELRGHDKNVVISFVTTGPLVGANVSLIFVKTTASLTREDDGQYTMKL